MTTSLECTARVPEDALDAILRPRASLVQEVTVASERGAYEYAATDGPVRSYRRVVRAVPSGDATVRVEQHVEYDLAAPLVRWLLALPARRHLGALRAEDTPPWWGPPDVLSRSAWAALGGLLAVAMVVGYLGTLLTETITYSAREFHVGTGAEGVALAAVRFDIVLSLGLVALADRRGRRVIALGGAAVGCLLTALGAFAPSLAWLAASQVVARAFVTAATIAAGVLAVEIMPKGARAWALGVGAMAGALGAGVAVVLLPVAGIDARAWRLLYLLALAWLGVVAVAARHLPESERFLVHHRAHDRAPIRRSRLALLASASFLLQLFVTPASEFQNEYLRRERHFSPGRIALFTIVTAVPGAIGILAGGRLADTHGRRKVAVVAVGGAAVSAVVAYSVHGWAMWLAMASAGLTGAAVTPVLTVYGPELFATSGRGVANGLLTAAGRGGAVAGLLFIGWAASSRLGFGAGFALLALGPVALVVLILTAFPETARRSLEELNPEDRTTASGTSNAAGGRSGFIMVKGDGDA
ncbi:MAG TPA: MFS transporter [Acidimicrobiales bacterium]|nr:MFS transporter [Acidimicrobiales bacterium]